MNRVAKTLLVTALVAVVAMAFRVSWNALRDVAATVGADAVAARLYPFVVDGLMALALVATLALTGEDRRFALRVLATYTLASLVLNYTHGLVPELHGGGERMRIAEWDPANWALVLLATSLPVGAIFFGSDLVAKVLHHRPQSVRGSTPKWDRTAVAPGPGPAEEVRTPVRTPSSQQSPYAQVGRRTPAVRHPERTAPVRPARTPVRDTRSKVFDEAELERTRQRAEQVYADSLDAGSPIGPAALGREFGFSEGWGRKRIKAVDSRRTRSASHFTHLVGATASEQ
ncbi:DUF2637 domain-containing protein [Streptomyces sp. NEAU-Y11]|uniref:DUF2637 domain-containing protein n=1 Tax=Streptomyces cucumeris TaxID=2962890 RepID=UPI0020C8B812|nr:DUF2637 domain-containing protein [Streptomyces sp. NEAU-Y11]MCP9207107.1 DUF2637 domain-containing protein [Streptomyces sp. NEAU-Y11]